MSTLRLLVFVAVPATALTAFLTLLSSSADTPKPEGKRLALVVGVNDYDSRKLVPLKYAERDATELAKVLKAAGFTVRVLLGSAKDADEATRANVETALKDLLKGATRRDVVLLAFSGHGQQMFVQEAGVRKEVPFFCAKDAVPSDAATLVSFNAVLRSLDERGGGSNLLLVDACRNVVDPDKGARGGVDGKRIDALREGTAIFFSCSGRQRARETDKAGGGHGVFFHFVLEGLRGAKGAVNERGQVTWEHLVPYVKQRVRDDFPTWFADLPESERQLPHALGNLVDDPVLVPAGQAPKTVALDLGGGVKLKMVRIPAKGKSFWMGSPKTEKERNPLKELLKEDFDAEEQHEVEFSRDYYLGVTEVTQGQYRAIMDDNPSYFRKGGEGEKSVEGVDTDDFPVENVNWTQAKKFCEKLAEKLRDGQEYRLPTEAEWEYACRGGASSKDSVPFYLKNGPTSSLSSGQINFNGNFPYGDGEKGKYLERTARCGSFAESMNAFGLYDMHGNVWEWCEDWYGKYPKERVKDPTGPGEGSDRVLRGGGWFDYGQSCRAAYRLGGARPRRHQYLGFRLARVPVR